MPTDPSPLSDMADRIYRYEEARALVPTIREITAGAVERVQELTAEMARSPEGSLRARKLREWISTAIQHWAEAIHEVGGQPKGVWTVDFDSGEGFYYCWTFDEDDLTYYHRYEEGFVGRKPLGEDARPARSPMLLS